MLINVKMPTIVGILTFMSRINFMISRVEHEKKFYSLRPGPKVLWFYFIGSDGGKYRFYIDGNSSVKVRLRILINMIPAHRVENKCVLTKLVNKLRVVNHRH